MFGYRLLLKTENWKYDSKIIFKYVNSTVGLSFEVVFAEKSTCRFREQCTRPTGKHETRLKSVFQYYPNIH